MPNFIKYSNLIYMKLCILFILCILISMGSSANAENDLKERDSYYKSFSYFTGYSHAKLKNEKDYQIIPSIFRFAFDMDKAGIGAADITEYIANKVFNNSGLEVKGETEFLAETFLNTVISPDINLEVGFDLLVKYSYPVTDKINPYFFSGGGVTYMTQHTDEQSTQVNYIPQLGVGVSYDLKEDFSLDFEYRYRHLSNANRRKPNKGINANMFLIGATWKF